MKEKGLDCLIVYGAYHWGGTDTGQVNAQYLANYTPIPHSYVVLPLVEEASLFVSFGNVCERPGASSTMMRWFTEGSLAP